MNPGESDGTVLGELYQLVAMSLYFMAMLGALIWGAIQVGRNEKWFRVFLESKHLFLWGGLLLLSGLSVLIGIFAVLAQELSPQYFASIFAFSMGMSLIISAIVYPAAVNLDKPSQPDVFRQFRPEAFIVTIVAIVWSFGSIFLMLRIASLFAGEPVEMEMVDGGMADLFDHTLAVRFASLFFFGLVAAITEEIIFRGALQSALKQLIGAWGGVILAALLWTLGHAGAYIEPVGLKEAQIFGLGLILGWAKERYGLGAAIGIHFINNLLALTLTPFIDL